MIPQFQLNLILNAIIKFEWYSNISDKRGNKAIIINLRWKMNLCLSLNFPFFTVNPHYHQFSYWLISHKLAVFIFPNYSYFYSNHISIRLAVLPDFLTILIALFFTVGLIDSKNTILPIFNCSFGLHPCASLGRSIAFIHASAILCTHIRFLMILRRGKDRSIKIKALLKINFLCFLIILFSFLWKLMLIIWHWVPQKDSRKMGDSLSLQSFWVHSKPTQTLQ